MHHRKRGKQFREAALPLAKTVLLWAQRCGAASLTPLHTAAQRLRYCAATLFPLTHDCTLPLVSHQLCHSSSVPEFSLTASCSVLSTSLYYRFLLLGPPHEALCLLLGLAVMAIIALPFRT